MVSGLPSSADCIQIEIVEGVQASSSKVTAHAFGVGDIENRISLGTALNPLEDARQETIAERVFATIGLHATGNKSNKARQILVFGTQSIGYPRAHAGPTGPRTSCVQ